jgi:type I restriction enzyme S subunit
MKSGWQTSTLGDVLAVIRNGVNCKQDKSGNGDKISRIESISAATFDLDKVGYAELTERDKEKNRLQQGDILFSHINSAVHVGKTAVFDCGEPVYHGVNLLLMRPKEVVTSAFLDHALKYLFQSGYWRGVCKQSVNQASVNQQDISRVEIRYPRSLAEQQRIVGILDEAFEGIATAKANAEKNLQNARALFESHLQSVFTQRGEGWAEKALGDVCELENGDRGKNYPNRNEYVDTGIPWINTGHIQPDGTLSMEEMNFITREKFNSLRSGKIQPGDLVYCLRGATLGKTALVDPLTEGAVASSLVIVRPSSLLDSKFLYFFLTSPPGQGLIKGFENGAAQPNLGARSVAKYPILLPTEKEQEAIADRLTELREETQRLATIYERKLAALDELKKSLLQQAFSGNL